jgi:tRNA G37 N-methylase TrmD
MRIDIMTLFPEAVNAMLGESILGRAASGNNRDSLPPDPGLH